MVTTTTLPMIQYNVSEQNHPYYLPYFSEINQFGLFVKKETDLVIHPEKAMEYVAPGTSVRRAADVFTDLVITNIKFMLLSYVTTFLGGAGGAGSGDNGGAQTLHNFQLKLVDHTEFDKIAKTGACLENMVRNLTAYFIGHEGIPELLPELSAPMAASNLLEIEVKKILHDKGGGLEKYGQDKLIQTSAIQKTDAVNFMQTVLNRFGDEQSRSKYVEGASYKVTSQSETEYHFENKKENSGFDVFETACEMIPTWSDQVRIDIGTFDPHQCIRTNPDSIKCEKDGERWKCSRLPLRSTRSLPNSQLPN